MEVVFGKAGQAETLPLTLRRSRCRNRRELKPPDQWRPGVTWEKLIAEMTRRSKTPGHGRTSSGCRFKRARDAHHRFRSVLGIKVFGPDLGVIQDIGVRLRRRERFPNTRSAFAERNDGRILSRLHANRQVAARYRLTVGDITILWKRPSVEKPSR